MVRMGAPLAMAVEQHSAHSGEAMRHTHPSGARPPEAWSECPASLLRAAMEQSLTAG